MRPWIVVFLLVVLFGPTASASNDLDGRVDKIIANWEGEWVGTWPGSFANHPEKESVPAWAVIKRVNLPAFGKKVLYKEIRAEGPTGPIVRQRIMVFADDPDRLSNALMFYPIMKVDAENYARSDLETDQLRNLTPAGMLNFPPGCAAHIIGDHGAAVISVSKESCVMLHKATLESRYTDFQIVVGSGYWTFFEAAFDVDGNYVYGDLKPDQFTKIDSR